MRRTWRSALHDAPLEWRAPSASALLLPPAIGGLLPIDDGMACRLVGLPALARFGDGCLVATIEQLEAALVIGHAFGASAVGDEQESRAVWILVEVREPDRLAVGVAVPGGAMRQEAVGIMGPQMRVQRIDPLGRAQHDHRPLARLK